MKKLMIVLISLIILPVSVYAGGDEEEKPYKAPILQCSYNIKHNKYEHRIEIYYYNNEAGANYNEWSVKYYAGDEKKDVTKGPKSFSDIFGTSGSPNIYMSDSLYKELKENHTCPKKGYLDTSARNEICFDNGDGWCKKQSNSFTDLAEQDSTFESSDKDTDKQEDVADRLSNEMNKDVTDELIESGQQAVQEQVNKTTQEIINEEYNVDDGGVVSDADKNYYYNNQETITEKPKEELKSRTEQLKEQLEKDFQNGLIDEETYNEKKDILDNYDDGNINDIYKNVFADNFAVDVVIVNQNCSSLLGDPNPEPGEPNTPAFYLVVVFTVIKYVAIILLIVLTIMDFVGAVASHDNDMLKKATSKAIKRALLCILIFVLPTLIEFILKYINESAEGLCGIN